MSRSLYLVPGILAVAVLAALPARVAVHAQAPALSPDQLTTQLITADALPGWVVKVNLATTLSTNGTVSAGGTSSATDQQLTVAERVFAPANQGKALIAVALLLPPSGTDVSALAPQLQDGTLLRSLANGATQGTVADFALTGSQGIGQDDQSATFTGTLAGDTYQFAGEVDIRDGEIAIAMYGGDSTQIDAPTALSDAVNIAQIEDAYLQNTIGSGGAALR